jgi:divalent metal cation (Fe/Co/Zn/Cd) transporter
MGLALSVLAAIANAACAWVMLRAARSHRSITLEADARHLLTDVWTTAGVFVGVILVQVTGWLLIDPIVALPWRLQIIWTGWHLMVRSFNGLMDRAHPRRGPRGHHRGPREAAPRRQRLPRAADAGRRAKSFVDVHVLVPGKMSGAGRPRPGREARERDPVAPAPCRGAHHLEPLEDPKSWDDPQKPRRF